jgi:SAM-dependent methyltransferase
MASSDAPTGTPQAGVALALARTAAQYDEVPYQSHAFPRTQPARLAAIATLFGLSPPPVPTARILEIGCAAGGNLIPLAARLPDTTCLGIDLSGVQIEQGQRSVRGLGLRNIELRQQSVTQLGAGDGPFDYVICHGVYSWVPDDVRAAILRVCGTCLSDNGIAIVSYNVRPGWHMKLALRDALLAHAAHIADPSQKIAQARWLIEFLKDRVGKSAYGNALREEASLLADLRDDYVLHEFLEDDNSPCTVTEFVRAAEGAGLGYLGETDLTTMNPALYGEETAVLLHQLAGGRLLAMEQYIDILTGRTFRQSILTKVAAAGARLPLDPARLSRLHVSSRIELDAEASKDGLRVFRDSAGRTLATGGTGIGAAMEMLAGRYPATATPGELAALVAQRTASREAPEAAVTEALDQMLNAGMLDLYAEPIRIGAASSQRPCALALARYHAAQGAPVTANLRHEPVPIDVAWRLLLPLLDGTRDREALCEGLLQGLAGSDARLLRDGQPITRYDERRDAALGLIEHMLKVLENSALLQPE